MTDQTRARNYFAEYHAAIEAYRKAIEDAFGLAFMPEHDRRGRMISETRKSNVSRSMEPPSRFASRRERSFFFRWLRLIALIWIKVGARRMDQLRERRGHAWAGRIGVGFGLRRGR